MSSGIIPAGYPAKSASGALTRDASSVTIIPLFHANNAPVGNVYLGFGCDFGKVELRVAIRVSGKGWNVQTVQLDSAADWSFVQVPAGASHASVCRVDRGVPAEANTPVAWGVAAKAA